MGATIGSLVVIAAALLFVDVRAGVIMFVLVNVYQQVENPAARHRVRRTASRSTHGVVRALRHGRDA